MTGKIALEEHFALAETLGDSERYFPPAVWQRMYSALTDIHEKRLAEMDQHGIETAILSLNSPAIQGIYDTRRAIEIARIANDFLAEQVAKNPPRFQGFAALPMQDPDAAAREFTRCVKELGFRGAAVNGFSQKNVEDSAVYYDTPHYESFWATVEQLDVPFYLHPRDPLFSRQQHYEGHPWFVGPVWAFRGRDFHPCAALDGQRAVRPPSEAHHYPGASGRGHPFQYLARRSSAAQRRARHAREKTFGGVSARELLSDHEWKFPHANADRLHARSGRGSHFVFRGLSV